jgi:hypothetical protein
VRICGYIVSGHPHRGDDASPALDQHATAEADQIIAAALDKRIEDSGKLPIAARMTTTGWPGRWRRLANGTSTRSMVRTGVFCLVEVELRGLEPLTPCLQIAVITQQPRRELADKLSTSSHSVPPLTGVNGTLMARPSGTSKSASAAHCPFRNGVSHSR